MILLLAATLQTVEVAKPDTIDLTIPRQCQEAKSGEEVVVCANRSGESPYRLKQPAQKERGPAKAQVQVADGVTAGAETENVDVGGFPSNRLMLRLKMKF